MVDLFAIVIIRKSTEYAGRRFQKNKLPNPNRPEDTNVSFGLFWLESNIYIHRPGSILGMRLINGCSVDINMISVTENGGDITGER